MLNYREELELLAAREMALLWFACTFAAAGTAALLLLAWLWGWMALPAAATTIAFEAACGLLSARQFLRCRRRVNQLVGLR